MSLRRLVSWFSAVLCSLGCAAPPRPAASAVSPAAEIAAVYAQFSAAANDHAWTEMVELFAEDASWQASAGDLGFRHQGRRAIDAWLRANQDKVEVLFYLAAPPRVELVTPALARAQTSMNELLLIKPSGELKQFFGVYRDELRKSDGRWRFVARRFELRRELTVAQ